MKTHNALGEEKIGKLLLQYSLPAITATVASSLYNVIDRIFLGQGVGPLAISGLALTMPLMNLLAAFGAMVGVGASTMISIRLGERNDEGAKLILGNALLLNIIIGSVLALVCFLALDFILLTLGASPATLPYAKEFMQIILAGNVFTHIYLGLNSITRASGYPRKAMRLTLWTVFINLILAPLFIFIFHWGIKGAALATVIAQMIGTFIAIRHFRIKSHQVHFAKDYIKLKIKIIREIISIGISNFLMLICATLVVVIVNLSLKKYGGDLAIGAFGIISSIVGVFIMIIIGFNQGMQPIAGYNYGAKKMKRVLDAFKMTVFAATIISLLGFLLAELVPKIIVRIFTTDPELIQFAVNGMRLSFLAFPIVGFQMVASTFFQSTGKPKLSIIMSMSRQVIFLIPALLILPHFFDINGVWYAISASDFLAALVTSLLLRQQFIKHWNVKPNTFMQEELKIQK